MKKKIRTVQAKIYTAVQWSVTSVTGKGCVYSGGTFDWVIRNPLLNLSLVDKARASLASFDSVRVIPSTQGQNGKLYIRLIPTHES